MYLITLHNLNSEMAIIHVVFGCANGNAMETRRLYLKKFANRMISNRNVYSNIKRHFPEIGKRIPIINAFVVPLEHYRSISCFKNYHGQIYMIFRYTLTTFKECRLCFRETFLYEFISDNGILGSWKLTVNSNFD